MLLLNVFVQSFVFCVIVDKTIGVEIVPKEYYISMISQFPPNALRAIKISWINAFCSTMHLLVLVDKSSTRIVAFNQLIYFCVVAYLLTRQGRLTIILGKFRSFSIDLNLRWDVT